MDASRWRYVKILKNDDLSDNLDNCQCMVNPLDVEEDGIYLWISGKLSCYTAAVSSYSDQVPVGYIALSRCALYNTRLFPGDTVGIREAPIDYVVTALTVIPFLGWEETVNNRDGNNAVLQQMLNSYFEDSYRPICQGDCFEVLNNNREGVWFKVEKMTPNTAKSLYGIDYGIVASGNVVNISKETYNPETDTIRSSPSFNDLGGNAEAIAKLRKLIQARLMYPALYEGQMQNNGIILHGPKGCGKTSLAIAAAHEFSIGFKVINGAEFFNKFLGESEAALRNIFSNAISKPPFLLIFDNLDSFTTENAQAFEFQNRLLSQFVSLMDELRRYTNVFVIATTNKINDISLSLRTEGRFDKEINIAMPNEADRKEIIRVLSRGITLADDVDLDELADETIGYSGCDLKSLVRLATEQPLNDRLNSALFHLGQHILLDKPKQITKQHFQDALKVCIPTCLRDVYVEKPKTTFDEIGGLEDVKEKLRECVDNLRPNNSMFKTKPISGVLLFGPPGCGKTSLARALANEAKANFIYVNSSEIVHCLLGQSEKNLTMIFDKARNAKPCILFFDEIDNLASSRSSFSHHGHCSSNGLVSNLLNQMDGFTMNEGILVLAATNRKDSIDCALLRTGRFTYHIEVPPPLMEARIKIFQAYLRHYVIAKDVNLRDLSLQCDGFSGADIQRVCDIACDILKKEYYVQKKDKNEKMETPEIRNAHLQQAFDRFRQERAKEDDSARNNIYL